MICIMLTYCRYPHVFVGGGDVVFVIVALFSVLSSVCLRCRATQ